MALLSHRIAGASPVEIIDEYEHVKTADINADTKYNSDAFGDVPAGHDVYIRAP
jgi:uncharacterized protein (DUF433 family)